MVPEAAGSGRDVIASVEREYRRYRALAEDAIEQLSEEELHDRPGPADNSVATLMTHVAGNFRSRFTDFLASDGEKPWRHRDTEFEAKEASRAVLLATWDEGWRVLFEALTPLTDADLGRTVAIRSVPLTALEAVHRSLAHAAYHVGQIVYLAKSARGEQWRYLSIPPGRSEAYLADPELERKANRDRGAT